MDRFIAFEGPEGSGKSTQIRLLAEHLRAAGWRVTATREPGGTELGERIRDLLLAGPDTGITPQTEALLLNAARAEHLHKVIQPALRRREIVLSDRFSDSTLAYQGGGRGLPEPDLRTLQHFAIGEHTPGLRLLLDLPVEQGLHRRHRNAETVNRIDRERIEFHERVRATFCRLAADDPTRWVVIDALRPVPMVHAQVVAAVVPWLGTSTAEPLAAARQTSEATRTE